MRRSSARREIAFNDSVIDALDEIDSFQRYLLVARHIDRLDLLEIAYKYDLTPDAAQLCVRGAMAALRQQVSTPADLATVHVLGAAGNPPRLQNSVGR